MPPMPLLPPMSQVVAVPFHGGVARSNSAMPHVSVPSTTAATQITFIMAPALIWKHMTRITFNNFPKCLAHCLTEASIHHCCRRRRINNKCYMNEVWCFHGYSVRLNNHGEPNGFTELLKLYYYSRFFEWHTGKNGKVWRQPLREMALSCKMNTVFCSVRFFK